MKIYILKIIPTTTTTTAAAAITALTTRAVAAILIKLPEGQIVQDDDPFFAL